MSYGVGLGVYGSDVYGSVLALSGETDDTTRGLRVVIAGVDVSDFVSLESFEVEEDLAGRTQASMQLVNDDLTLRLHIGEPVICTIDGTRRFAGTIESIREVVPDTTTTIIYEVECVDFNQLCDRHYVAARYDVDGQTLRDVVEDIVEVNSSDFGECLTDEGITITSTSVQEGPELATIVFSYQTAAEAFDDLAELTGFWWRVDYNKVLHFVDRMTYAAPQILDADIWPDFGNVRVTRGREQYRNQQVLRGGRDISETRIERFKGDGEKRSFELSLPAALKPSQIKVNAGVISLDDIGVRQKDDNKKWYYQIDDKTISQDSSETVLGTGDTLEVTYRGLFPIIVISRVDSEVTARQLLEGGTGIYSKVDTDQKIDDIALAEDKVSALLRRYANIPDEVTFTTTLSGFSAGQIMQANLPEHELQGEFLVTDVRLSFLGYDDNQDEVYQYAVRIVDGEFLGGWTEFYKRQSRAGRPFSIRENEDLLLIRDFHDVISITDTIGTSDPLAAYTVDVNTFLRVGGNWVAYRSVATNFDVSTLFVVNGPRIAPPVSQRIL